MYAGGPQTTEKRMPAGDFQGVLDAIESLPISVHGALTAALIGGLAMWALGRRLLKPIFALIGAAVGGLAGTILLPIVGVPAVMGVPSPAVGLGIGGFVGLLTSIVLFRFVISIAMTLALGVAGVLGSATYVHFRAAPAPSGNAIVESARLEIADARARAQQLINEASTTSETEKRPAARVQAFVAEARAGISERWYAQNERDRLIISIAGAAGALLGMLIGVAMPNRSTAAGTAMFGAAIWLPALVSLSQWLDLPGRETLARPVAIQWLGIWLATAGIGFAIQLHALSKSKPKKPAPKEEG